MKIKNNTRVKRLLADYQNGSMEQNDRQIIDNWFDNHHKTTFDDVFTDAGEESRIYNELSNRLNAGINDAPVRRLWYSQLWLKAACIIFLVSFTAILLFKYRQHAPPVGDAGYQTVATDNGKVKQVLLNDGTRIWLNAGSRLRFAHTFNTAKQRIIYLDKGEAYFEVKHDVKRPFKVISGNFQTIVLGTSFNIRAYHVDREYKVVVASGMVSVGITGKNGQYLPLSSGLVKGQVLKYHTAQKQTEISQVPIASQLAWINGGAINIDSLNLKYIGEELARNYNIGVTVTHPEYDTKWYSISLNHHDLGSALKQLTLKTGMSYKLEKNQLTIYPQNPLMK